MKPRALLSRDLSPPFLNLPSRSIISKSPPSLLAFLRRNTSIRIRNSKNPNFKVMEAVRFDGPVVDVGELESDECELVVETCVTRNLAPALSVEHGIESIKEALEELEMNPPCSSSGVLRYQVLVPPSPKALNWFCCQPDSSGVFPRFFVSKEIDDPNVKSLYLNRTRGVFGIGAAIYFVSPSSNPEEHGSVRRYLSSDSNTIAAYGFMDIHFNTNSSSIRHETGSFYFIIPEIELDEHDDVSILKATLAWDDTLLRTFEKRIQSLKLSIYQVSCHSWPSAERCHSEYLKLGLKEMKLEENKSFQMVSVNALFLERRNYVANPLELRGSILSCQFCFWLSPTVGVSNNMLDYSQKMDCSLQDSANINVVWASLIVEECSRLGLTYFCVAPGSRSSPLAIAASSHPLTTCIACFDERSLAFHAVGYARGSHKPAVVITSSGTAVSNLLPAVVEASQDFVPLILLTADRPPELHDVGANQSINQVNHFGSFVRFFFNLPPPTDEVPARMVLTTIDSAVNLATSSPYGPVHVNCPFREPLHGSRMPWLSNCLKGLDIWMSSSKPFTKYIQLQHSLNCNGETHITMTEVDKIIQGARRGLLLIGAVHSDDEIWATLLLASHLNWPIVADILSGLRLRKILPSLCEFDGECLFLDHFDHALLSDSVRCWVQFDVILQIGSRITSKRVAQMLEEINPGSYILIDNHPYRHDSSHLVTHRVQCSILEFACSLVKTKSPCRTSKWAGSLQTLNKMVAWDISFQISAENSLTEPYVAHVISTSLSTKSALFVGNSMAIRDIDLYGCSWESQYGIPDTVLNSELQCLGVRVAGNRGASGIDGLLSTGIGFATGSNKKVLAVIGDISFLHDANGLAILNQRIPRKPVTIFVINNHGGAIFSLLPIADRTDEQILNQYFYTSHNISIQNLCMAHGVRHLQAKTKLELQDALIKSQCEATDCIIEVESCIKANSTFHSTLRKSACRAANQAASILSRLCVQDNISDGILHYKIDKMEYAKYRIHLSAPLTSRSVDQDHNKFHKDGYILSLHLEDGSIGHGEVAPFEIEEENFLDIEEQLKFILHVIKGTKISFSLSLLKGSFTSWIWNCLGIKEFSIHPSVRCGLEMAILNVLASKEGSSLLNILQPHSGEAEIYDRTSSVKICALLDSNGAPSEVAYVASSLVEEGFTTIKLKVARRADPIQDAAVVREIRKKVGRHIELRVDANRNWTYEEAIQFGCHVKDCDLQYIEEPVQVENDILKYCEETGLPVALDETIDNLPENSLEVLAKYTHPAIVAVVIKPSFIGGLEKAALIAQWAHQHGKMAVVSAAFESGLGLSTYILFSYYLETQSAEVGRIMNRQPCPSIAHGLGTFKWLKEDVATEPFDINKNSFGGFVGANVSDTIQFLQKFEINHRTLKGTFDGEEVCSYCLTLDSKDFSSSIKVHEVGSRNSGNVVVFIHGFLGTGDDWVPIMKAISASARCISVDLPGHGGSKIDYHGGIKFEQEALATLSVEMVAEVLCKLIQLITPGNVVVVGYSMGARIALHMALKRRVKIDGAVIISGSPGLEDIVARKTRQAKDDSRARALLTYGLPVFLDSWYAGELWKSLRRHPHFKKIASKRLQHDNIHGLAKALSGLSIGSQEPLWEDLKHCKSPLLLIVGEEDHKFKAIAQKMCNEVHHFREDRDHDVQKNICEMIEVSYSGHAVHLENPLQVVRVLSQFLCRLRKSSTLEHNEVEL